MFPERLYSAPAPKESPNRIVFVPSFISISFFVEELPKLSSDNKLESKAIISSSTKALVLKPIDAPNSP